MFKKADYRDFFFGFAKKDHTRACAVEVQIMAAYKEQFPSDPPNDYWPVSTYYEQPYRNWGKEAFEAILSGRLAEDIKAKLEILAKIARQVCPDEAIGQK